MELITKADSYIFSLLHIVHLPSASRMTRMLPGADHLTAKTNVSVSNVNGSPWQLLRADQNDSSFILKEIYRLSPQHFSLSLPLSLNAHCGPDTRWGQKDKTPGVILSSFTTAISRMASGVLSKRKHTCQGDYFSRNVTDLRGGGPIAKPQTQVFFLRNIELLKCLQAALRRHVKQGCWSHFTELDPAITASLAAHIHLQRVWFKEMFGTVG